MSVVVVSSLYGGYDAPHRQTPQTVDAEWVMVTDGESPHSTPWRTVVEPRPDVHPRLAAKVAKCAPWAYADADAYVWMDAACVLERPDALQWLLDQSEGHAITQFRHPWRQCIWDEAIASEPLPKYLGRPVLEQAKSYLERGYPERWGLWATGLIVYRMDTPYPSTDRPALNNLGRRWLTEQLRWTYQDQISEGPCLWDVGLYPWPLSLPGGGYAPLHGSGYLSWANHRDEL